MSQSLLGIDDSVGGLAFCEELPEDQDIPETNEAEDFFPLDKFHHALKKELDTFAAAIRNDRSITSCKLCPCRRFDRATRLEDHLKKHAADRLFACSGRPDTSACKQYLIAKALADNDIITTGQMKTDYLSRSATIMGNAIDDRQNCNVNYVNQLVVVVLRSDGPHIVSSEKAKTENWDRYGDTYFDHGFALYVWRKCIIYNSNLNRVLVDYVGDSQLHGELASLVSRRREFWVAIAEKIFYNQQCETYDF